MGGSTSAQQRLLPTGQYRAQIARLETRGLVSDAIHAPMLTKE
jgi:hypothetical protein